MRVAGKGVSGLEIDAHLDDLTSGHAEIVTLQLGALDSCLLRLDDAQRHGTCEEEYRYGNDSNRCRVNLLAAFTTGAQTRHRARSRRVLASTDDGIAAADLWKVRLR